MLVHKFEELSYQECESITKVFFFLFLSTNIVGVYEVFLPPLGSAATTLLLSTVER